MTTVLTILALVLLMFFIDAMTGLISPILGPFALITLIVTLIVLMLKFAGVIK